MVADHFLKPLIITIITSVPCFTFTKAKGRTTQQQSNVKREKEREMAMSNIPVVNFPKLSTYEECKKLRKACEKPG